MLKKVNTQGGATTPQPNASATAVTTSVTRQTPVTTIAETPSQTPTTGNDNVSSRVFSSTGKNPSISGQIHGLDTNANNQALNRITEKVTNNKTLATTIPNHNAHVVNTLAPSSANMIRSNNSDVSNATTNNMTDTPASNTSLHPRGKITEKARTEQDNNVGSIPRVQQVVISDSDGTGHSDATELSPSSRTEKTSTVSNGNANTLSKLSASTATDKDSQNGNARRTSRKRKRDSTKASDLIAEKRLNGEESKDDVEGTWEGLKDKTGGVVLSDTRHGLNHDIIVLSNSVPHQGQHGVGMDANETLGRASKRKQDERGSTIKTTRGRKRSNQSGGEGNMHGNMSSGDIEQVETSSRYPKRSKHGQRNVNGNTLVGLTANKIIEDSVSEPIPASNERNNSFSPGSASNTGMGNNPYLHVKRVIMNSDIRLPQVPAIPLLPPSSTTLSAFKKMLTLRKDLESQANHLNVTNHTANLQAADQPENQNGQSSNSQNASITTSLQNPLADRLVLVSNTKQTSHEEFRNSIAYQQLLNRFKGLFMWPGFLSIVNPSFKNNEGPNQTTQTPKNKRRTYRRRTR